MKIRNGFVSNSSSASYIIKIEGMKLIDLLGILGYGEEFCKETMLNDISKKIFDLNKDIDSFKNKKHNSLVKNLNISFLEGLENELKEIQSIDKNDDLSILKKYLKMNGIKHEETDKELILEYFTPMHNSFVEGICDQLKELIFKVIFSTGHKIKCEIISDQ